MSLLGGKNSVSLVVWRQPLFPTTDTKFQATRRMKGGWVQAEDLYMVIIYFLVKMDKNTPENPWNLAENPPGKPWKRISFHSWPPWNNLRIMQGLDFCASELQYCC